MMTALKVEGLAFLQDSLLIIKTPQARFELATSRLTVDRSTTELLRNALNVI